MGIPPLLLLLVCSTAMVPWTGSTAMVPWTVRALSNISIPSADCPTTCGPLGIDFPFGVGPGCFLRPEFELICNGDTLFLKDGVTEVLDDILAQASIFDVSFSHAISTTPDVLVYNMSWKSPTGAFGLWVPSVNVTGCDFDAYLLGADGNPAVPICTVKCSKEGIPVAAQDCTDSPSVTILPDTLDLQFVRHKDAQVPHNTNRSIAWDTIDVTISSSIFWSISDGRSCDASSADKATYACVSDNSLCSRDNVGTLLGYTCSCRGGYIGNPYKLGGCSRDYGYDPVQQKQKHCPSLCGNINVPFPFGLEEGCCASRKFRLNCENASASKLHINDAVYVKHINVNEGYMEIEDTGNSAKETSWAGQYDPDSHYINYGEPTKVQWAVANLTCHEAQHHSSTYACLSVRSVCLPVNSANSTYGYRCKCLPGFTGNPYVPSGCENVDECTTPDICEGSKCQNTHGGYYCISRRRQNILLGVAIGLSVGFCILLLILTAVFTVHKWRRNIQRKLRRKYFRKNKGLLLEQLISSDENASDKTKIFSLAKLEKATNNFDHTRILGRGGHGMVYKGILSDQNVVAIKKSKVVEQGEIDQFINEVVILSQVNHRNIVKLYGCCLETEVPLLVYDFVPNGSLFEILHTGSSTIVSLSWDDCLRIAAEAAGALCYLHSAASVSVFHRDVKSSNILLDANYTAKVSDFGASRLVNVDQTHVSTKVQGTFGYLDPEYYHTGQLNEKSDVYSFGVLILELLLRRKPIFTTESGSAKNLSIYFLEELKERPIKEVVAPQVQEEATEEEINNVASLAQMCLRNRGEERPSMKEVEMSLQFLRTRRLNSCCISPENDEDIHPFLRTRAKARVQYHSGNIIDSFSTNSQQCYSLEQESLSSVGLPR